MKKIYSLVFVFLSVTFSLSAQQYEAEADFAESEEQEQNGQDLKIYPTVVDADGIITVKNAGEGTPYAVYSIREGLLQNGEIKDGTVVVSSLKTGVYVLNIADTFVSFIKNR